MKDFKIFYGWWIVGALFLISGYFAGIVRYSFTALIEPLTKEFSWSYTTTKEEVNFINDNIVKEIENIKQLVKE